MNNDLIVSDEEGSLFRNIRGWVYVITNPSMKGIAKVGYSTRDPIIRAVELGGTGSPTPYQVEFDALVLNPRQLETQVHKHLSDLRVGKEWFRCETVEAISAILNVAEGRIIAQNFRDISLKHSVALSIGAQSALPKSREVNGVLFYVCNSCKRETKQSIRPVARCDYCGKTAIWNG